MTSLDPQLATDGIDEALRVMYGGYPDWAGREPADTVGRLITTDTGAQWLVRLGGFSGTSPNSGKTYDREPTIEVLDQPADPAFTVSGSAADLDTWLWRRPTSTPVRVDGDQDAFARLERVLAAGIP